MTDSDIETEERRQTMTEIERVIEMYLNDIRNYRRDEPQIRERELEREMRERD